MEYAVDWVPTGNPQTESVKENYEHGIIAGVH